jgi:membrane-bound serine protease (ClpP class)
VTTGAEQMIGAPATVVEWRNDRGRVHSHGEIWAARSAKPLQPQDQVKVVDRDGLTLIVEP